MVLYLLSRSNDKTQKASMNPELSTILKTAPPPVQATVLGSNILVVVDMQMGFAAALEPWLLDAVEAEVRRANQDSMPDGVIIVLP